MRAAFIPALPPSALLAGMIAPSFRLVNRFCGKKLLRTCGRRERPPALCAVWARSPLAYVKGSLPFDRSLWHGPSLRRTQATRALRAPERRKKRASPHPAAVLAGPCSLSQSAEAPLHAPAPAAAGASPRPPLAPWVRASPAPAARERFECPKARREACALWALGPKAQSDPQRGSETMSATVREARMIEQPGHKKRGKRQTAAHTAGPLARTSPQRFGEPQLSKLKSESSDMRGGFGSLAQARLPYAGRRPASQRRSRWRSRRPAHPPPEKIGASRAFPTRS